MRKHKMQPKYNEDFYAWTFHTAQLLREKKMDEVDFDNVIEEIETLGRSQWRELKNRLGVLIAHLMKMHYQPNLKSPSWETTIVIQRLEIVDLLEENPSLKYQINDMISNSYKYALCILIKETGIKKNVFPTECPYTFDQIIDDEFYPE